MATTFLAPDPIQSKQFIPGGIVPANGGQLFFYTAGTSTKETVYKDNAAGSAWTNPIVLDSGGDLPSGGEVWFTQGVTYKVVFAPATDSDPPVSPYWTKDNLAGVNDATASGGGGNSGEWTAGPTPTFVSGTAFRVSGDLRSTFDAGRRVKATVSGGTAYVTITSSALASGSTAVGVSTSNSIAIDSGLSAVQYATLDAANPSPPPIVGTLIAISDPTNRSKAVSFSASSITASTVVNLNVGNSSGTLAMVEQLSFTQGQCRLQFLSSSQLQLIPYQGNLLPFPNRISVAITSGGITTSALTPLQAGSTLALLASQIYDVYAFQTSSALALDMYSTAAGNHSTDSATGIEILGGNSTRVYVGKVITDATSSYVFTQTSATNGTSAGANIGVISWFNRRMIAAETQLAIANSIGTNIVTEPPQKPRIRFITFGDDIYAVHIDVSGTATSASQNISVAVGLNNTSAAAGPTLLNTVTNANFSFPVSVTAVLSPAEGSHSASLLAGCTGNAATGTLSVSSMIHMTMRG
jgi:hypothetical protein